SDRTGGTALFTFQLRSGHPHPWAPAELSCAYRAVVNERPAPSVAPCQLALPRHETDPEIASSLTLSPQLADRALWDQRLRASVRPKRAIVMAMIQSRTRSLAANWSKVGVSRRRSNKPIVAPLPGIRQSQTAQPCVFLGRLSLDDEAATPWGRTD